MRARAVLVGLLAAAALAATADGAALDPGRLVLRQSDVPASYTFNARESGQRTLTQDSKGFPGLKAKYRSWGHVAGYQIRFDKGNDSIVSRADVFREPAGTRQMFAWFRRQVEKQNTAIHLRWSPLAIGDAGVTYSFAGGGVRFTVATWRYRRVFSVVGGAGLARSQVLALARTQQQRTANALS